MVLQYLRMHWSQISGPPVPSYDLSSGALLPCIDREPGSGCGMREAGEWGAAGEAQGEGGAGKWGATGEAESQAATGHC